MSKETFTRKEVESMFDELLQRPQILIDAVNNEYTDYDAAKLVELSEEFVTQENIKRNVKKIEELHKKLGVTGFSF